MAMMKSVRHWWHQRSGASATSPHMLTEVAFATGPTGLPFGAGGPAVKLNRANGGRKPVRVELLVIDDLTLSAHNRAQVICETTRSAFEALEQTALEARFGYLGSRDRGHGEADELRVVHGTAAQVLREQMTVTRAGGGDAPETFGDSLLDALDTYPFTHAPDVVSALLLLCTDDSKPTQGGLSMEAVGERCRLARKHVFVVGEPGSNTEAIVLGAGAFGGGFLELKANPTPQEVQLIARRLTGTLVGSLNQLSTGTVPASALVPSGFTVPGP
jgi:hypothetical protein